MSGTSARKTSSKSKNSSSKTRQSLPKSGKGSTPKTDLQFGVTDLLDRELKDENAKIRITTYIDLDLYKLLNAVADEKNVGYQTLLNEALRSGMLLLGKQDQFLDETVGKLMARLQAALRTNIISQEVGMAFVDIFKGQFSEMRKTK